MFGTIGCRVLVASALAVLSHAAGVCTQSGAPDVGHFRWPEANLGLVAPVSLIYAHQKYHAPLMSTFTGKVLSVELPQRFPGEIRLESDWPVKNPSEAYILERLDISKSGRLPSGTKDRLQHAVEVSLVHKRLSTNEYAIVTIPFVYTPGAGNDVLAPLIDEAELPTQEWDQAPLAVSGKEPINVDAVYHGANFYHFWKEMDLGCTGEKKMVRNLLRSSPVETSRYTILRLLPALDNQVVETAETTPPKTWLMGGCSADSRSCPKMVPTNLTAQLQEYEQLQARTLATFRTKKAALDTAMQNLEAGATLERYDAAAAARDELRSAEQQLDGIMLSTASVAEKAKVANNATWDEENPKVN